jgi:predicted O-methyltransferase YrrM
MNPSDALIESVLNRIYNDGREHDARQTEQSQKFLNITPSTGRFLELLIEEQCPKRILEIGTSNGYSTLWLARAGLDCKARVDSVDNNARKHELAAENLLACQLSSGVRLHTMEAGEFLRQAMPGPWDFIFLDSDRSQYVAWWTHILRLWGGGVIVCNNAVSDASEMQPLLAKIDADPTLERTILTIGNGQLLIRRRQQTDFSQNMVNGLPLITPGMP